MPPLLVLHLLLLESLPTRYDGGEGLGVALLALVHGGSLFLHPPPAVLSPGFLPRLLLHQHERRNLLLPITVLLVSQ